MPGKWSPALCSLSYSNGGQSWWTVNQNHCLHFPLKALCLLASGPCLLSIPVQVPLDYLPQLYPPGFPQRPSELGAVSSDSPHNRLFARPALLVSLGNQKCRLLNQQVAPCISRHWFQSNTQGCVRGCSPTRENTTTSAHLTYFLKTQLSNRVTTPRLTSGLLKTGMSTCSDLTANKNISLAQMLSSCCTQEGQRSSTCLGRRAP